MFTLVTGAVRNGKSDFGEKICLQQGKSKRLYIATMPFDQNNEETVQRVLRHRKMRKDRGFVTVEKHTALHELDCHAYDVVLLECMGNLLANEMFMDCGGNDILYGIEHLLHSVSHLVVITNDVFSDGLPYEESTQNYINALASINNTLAKKAGCVVELVCGIPFFLKREF